MVDRVMRSRRGPVSCDFDIVIEVDMGLLPQSHNL